MTTTMDPLIKILERRAESISADLPRLAAIFAKLDNPSDLSLRQAIVLLGLALDFAPDLIIELGRNFGHSTALFALAAERIPTRVESFDLVGEPWQQSLVRLGSFAAPAALSAINAQVGDLTQCDWRTLVGDANRVLVFWDAHGLAVADAVLSSLMPILAQRSHVVVCHDIQDNRHSGCPPYDGRPLWRGLDTFRTVGTAYVNLGWALGCVDQIVPIVDFCHRNQIELHSADHELALARGSGAHQAVLAALPLLAGDSLPVWFSLNEAPGPPQYPGRFVAQMPSADPIPPVPTPASEPQRPTASVADLQQENAAYRQHLDALQASWSWRLTGPLRWLGRVVGAR